MAAGGFLPRELFCLEPGPSRVAWRGVEAWRRGEDGWGGVEWGGGRPRNLNTSERARRLRPESRGREWERPTEPTPRRFVVHRREHQHKEAEKIRPAGARFTHAFPSAKRRPAIACRATLSADISALAWAGGAREGHTCACVTCRG